MGRPKKDVEFYAAKCSSCHGEHGEGTAHYPALVGGQGSLTSTKPPRTVGSYWPYATTVWDHIHRTMPYAEPGTLTPNETYSVTAYILFLNEVLFKAATVPTPGLLGTEEDVLTATSFALSPGGISTGKSGCIAPPSTFVSAAGTYHPFEATALLTQNSKVKEVESWHT